MFAYAGHFSNNCPTQNSLKCFSWPGGLCLGSMTPNLFLPGGGAISALPIIKCAGTDIKIMLNSVLLYQSLGTPNRLIVMAS